MYETGDDWAVFACYPNSNTGLLPVQAQEAFYRMSRDDDPETVRVTGYGVDNTPAGTGGGPTYCPDCNSDSQTLQTEVGSFKGEDEDDASDVVIKYRVDTESANSGSPVIIDGTTVTIGIHTIGGCWIILGTNKGTGFENDDLESAIQNFPGSNVEYADKDHPVTDEDGTVFRPYNTFAEAVTEVAAGGIVSVVTGYYNETMTISKAMTITAPVGVVTIGASGVGKLLATTPEATATEGQNPSDNLLPDVYSLSRGYPNPFNPTVTIPFGLPEASTTVLVVYDLMGREVTRLVDGAMNAGYHSAIWNGRTATGQSVASGIYIYRLVATSVASGERFIASEKMLLLK